MINSDYFSFKSSIILILPTACNLFNYLHSSETKFTKIILIIPICGFRSEITCDEWVSCLVKLKSQLCR